MTEDTPPPPEAPQAGEEAAEESFEVTTDAPVTTFDEGTPIKEQDSAQAEREEVIRNLLVICQENDIALPGALLSKIQALECVEGEDENGCRKTTHILKDLCIRRRTTVKDQDFAAEVNEVVSSIGGQPNIYEMRLEDYSYTVVKSEHPEPICAENDQENEVSGHKGDDIPTVMNQSPIYKGVQVVKKGKPVSVEKVLMANVNLRLLSGNMYLVLGSPGCGKSLLLKSIANLLRTDKKHMKGGSITLNGQSPDNKDFEWSNLVSYVDQIDRLHARMTVADTLNFSFECRCRGTHRAGWMPTDDPNVNEIIERLDAENWRVNHVMKGMGLTRVKDTFVGDESNVRGVSGGERKRVTVAEMGVLALPILCLDEMSTGLDAATTFDIVSIISRIMKFINNISVISLLQPPPEVFALFDEVIVLDKGQVIYSGPVDDVVSYFEDLGYFIPDRMDTADWLQSLPTPDGAKFLRPSEDPDQTRTHLTQKEFVAAFASSEKGVALLESLHDPLAEEVSGIPLVEDFTKKYQNPWHKSVSIVFRREWLLFKRDTYQLISRLGINLFMAIIVGTVFWQTEDAGSILGVLFQSLMYLTLNAMNGTSPQIETRGIFTKEQAANFFPTWTFVLGRSAATVPPYLIDTCMYGTIVYFFAGLAYNDGASIANFFVFLLFIFLAGFIGALIFSIFSATVQEKASAQGAMALTMVLMVVFSGFTVQPDVIPDYWIWAYWINSFAWMLRSVVVNEFQSGKYDDTIQGTDFTEGDYILVQFGFTLNDEPFDFAWVWYGLAFSVGMGIIAVMIATCALEHVKFDTEGSSSSPDDDEDATAPPLANEDDFDLPFQKVNLTFKDIRYTVKASTTDDYLELLKGIDGYVEAGRLTALMGSSGAGKTTLMDVLSLRKSSGEVQGEVWLNGHPQEEKSFRRCTGYVEQFDVQTPQLTIRETVEFSAKLRLDENDSSTTPENIAKFVDKTLDFLELNPIGHLLVGSDNTGGLSFEQRKRLSIAVELASNPSIIFLDEPTSGLDARAASICMRGLKKIAESGRAICATIHQPSETIFNEFDALLLLKRGGETVFFGDLGKESCLLIKYLEQFKATAKIQPGENAATWMLSVIGAGADSSSQNFDYASSYANSKLKRDTIVKIGELNSEASDQNLVSYSSKYATSRKTQRREVLKRLMKIYWRSPSYNLARIGISAVVALLFGSIYASERTPKNESDMNSRVTSIFVSTLFLGVTSFNTVLPVFEVERNMFYRHKAALMYNQQAINLAFTLAEIPFVLWSSMLFCICFYFLVGFSTLAYKFFLYYLFFFLNMWAFTYLGQMVMSLLRDSSTAMSFGSAFVGLSALFCGILIRPQLISSFWIFMYWLLPFHYVLEGLIASQFHDDDTPIEATVGSDFYQYLQCTTDDATCVGTAEDWIYVSFGGFFAWDHIYYCAIYLIGMVLFSRVVAYVALTNLNYLSK